MGFEAPLAHQVVPTQRGCAVPDSDWEPPRTGGLLPGADGTAVIGQAVWHGQVSPAAPLPPARLPIPAPDGSCSSRCGR